MNNITIAGQLGKDAETRYSAEGKAITSFSVADSQFGDKPPIWWSCAIFGERGDKLAPYLKKGQSVTVIGTVTEREYTDKEGNKRKAMDVRVGEIALQGGKREAEQPPAPAPRKPSQDAFKARQVAPSGFDDMDDDIPF
jgi:single-strand DNA-binding protein